METADTDLVHPSQVHPRHAVALLIYDGIGSFHLAACFGPLVDRRHGAAVALASAIPARASPA